MHSACLVVLKQVPADSTKMVINSKKKNEQLTIMLSECKEAENFTKMDNALYDYYSAHENFCFLMLLLLLLSRFVKVPVNQVWERRSIFINT